MTDFAFPRRGSNTRSGYPQPRKKSRRGGPGEVPVQTENDNEILSTTKLLRKMFESGTGDWELVGQDGKAVKFHQSVLSEQVAHFRAIFTHENTLEFVGKRIVLPEELAMGEHEIDAFLRYIYYQDGKLLASDFKLTCTLIGAGHYYNIPNLVHACNEIIFKNLEDDGKLDWFTVEDLWKLYGQVWMWEESHSYKKLLMGNIVDVIQKICQKNGNSEQLLLLTNGDPVLRDLIVQLCHQPPSSTLPSSRPLGFPWNNLQYLSHLPGVPD